MKRSAFSLSINFN